MDKQFHDTLDLAMMQERYGLKRETPVENHRLSKFELSRLVEKQRNKLELKDS